MTPWRPMRAADLAAVIAIADLVHVDHPEAPEVFADRLALFPAGCLVAEQDGRPLGYAIAHPAVLGVPPPLDTVLGRLPAGSDCLYLHDVALLPEARGRRLGAGLAALLEQLARRHGFPRLALTAVNGSDAFWHGLGFLPGSFPGLEAKLASYGQASYRTKDV